MTWFQKKVSVSLLSHFLSFHKTPAHILARPQAHTYFQTVSLWPLKCGFKRRLQADQRKARFWAWIECVNFSGWPCRKQSDSSHRLINWRIPENPCVWDISCPSHAALWVQGSCANSPHPLLCQSFRCGEGWNFAAALSSWCVPSHLFWFHSRLTVWIVTRVHPYEAAWFGVNNQRRRIGEPPLRSLCQCQRCMCLPGRDEKAFSSHYGCYCFVLLRPSPWTDLLTDRQTCKHLSKLYSLNC